VWAAKPLARPGTKGFMEGIARHTSPLFARFDRAVKLYYHPVCPAPIDGQNDSARQTLKNNRAKNSLSFVQ